MTEGVVYLFKAVDVKHQDCERMFITLRTVKFVPGCFENDGG